MNIITELIKCKLLTNWQYYSSLDGGNVKNKKITSHKGVTKTIVALHTIGGDI